MVPFMANLIIGSLSTLTALKTSVRISVLSQGMDAIIPAQIFDTDMIEGGLIMHIDGGGSCVIIKLITRGLRRRHLTPIILILY